MVKPANPRELLTRLVTRRGGELARLRRGVTAEEVALAVAFVRAWFPQADLADRTKARRTCAMAIDAALGPERTPAPDDDWDLVGLYARLRGVKRRQAYYELGLAGRLKPDRMMLQSQYAWFSRLVSTRGSGRRRRLRKSLSPEDVRRAVRLVQELYPHVDFVGNTAASGYVCKACFKEALRRHTPPWEPHKYAWTSDEHETLGWDLVAIYMRLTGIKYRNEACCELGLHAPLPMPADPYDYIDD